MKRRYLVVALLSVAVAVLGIRHWASSGTSSSPSRVTAVDPQKGASVAEQAARREAAERLAQMPAAPSHAPVERFSAELIQATEEAFRGMISVRGLVIQEQERGELAQQILATPEGSAFIREILLNPEVARAAFGDFQAEARFYSASVLKEMARQGDLDFVVDTAAQLGEQLASAGGEPDTGRAEDFMSVAAIIGESVGSDGLKDGNSPVLTKLGCNADLAKPVRVLCLRGLFQGVWAADGIEQAQAMVERLRTI